MGMCDLGDHLCSCGPRFVPSLPVPAPPDAPAHPLGTTGPFLAPLSGVRPLRLCALFSLLCRNELCDLLDLRLFLLLTCPGSWFPGVYFVCLASPSQCHLVAALSRTFPPQQQTSCTRLLLPRSRFREAATVSLGISHMAVHCHIH